MALNCPCLFLFVGHVMSPHHSDQMCIAYSGGFPPWKTQVGGKTYCGQRTTWDPTAQNGGYERLLSNGADPICNPNSDKPCCSQYGYCGNTQAHCSYQDYSVLAKDKNEREWTTRNREPGSLFGKFSQNTLIDSFLFTVTCPRDFPFRDADANLCKSGQNKKVPCASKSLVRSNEKLSTDMSWDSQEVLMFSKNLPKTLNIPLFVKPIPFFHRTTLISFWSGGGVAIAKIIPTCVQILTSTKSPTTWLQYFDQDAICSAK